MSETNHKPKTVEEARQFGRDLTEKVGPAVANVAKALELLIDAGDIWGEVMNDQRAPISVVAVACTMFGALGSAAASLVGVSDIWKAQVEAMRMALVAARAENEAINQKVVN